MFKNYLLITLRSMMKNKVFILINVFGMGIAIACCIVGYFANEFDKDFNFVHTQAKQLYRVSSMRAFDGEQKRFSRAPFPLGAIVANTISDVDKSTRYALSGSNFKREDDLFEANLAYVDPDFFTMFTFEFSAGSAAAITDESSVMISEDMAVRLFRTPADALGKPIKQVYGTEVKELKIAGVFKEPVMNSSFYSFRNNGSAYTNFKNYTDEFNKLEDDWKSVCTLFVEIDDRSRLQSVTEGLQIYKANNNRVRDDFQIATFVLDPFLEMTDIDRDGQIATDTWGAPPSSAIAGSMTMGILILLIACFNLTNTAIAISSRRLKEIGVRKVMGSMRHQLIFQFISETMFICFLALLVGLALGDVLIAGWNAMWSYMHLTPHYLDNPSFLIFIIGVLFGTGILAGSYPAFYISKFEPIRILKGTVQFGGTNNFTRTLLGLQFAISIIAIISAIGFIENARYQKAYDLGFNSHSSIITWLEDEDEFKAYEHLVQSNPKVIATAGASSSIGSNVKHVPVKYESKQVEVDLISVGDNYLNVLQLDLLEGRDFANESRTDQKESILVTQKMAALFGWEQPLGKEVIYQDSIHLYVVGVVRDVYMRGLWREMEPMMIRYILPNQYTQLVASARTEDVSALHVAMGEQWKELFPNRLYNGRMLSEDQSEMIKVNNNIVIMFTLIGIIAMMLSVTGLFTLVSLNIIKRMKEIGVRKVLGASIGSITRIINTEFVIILSLAALMGCAFSYYLINALMSTIWKYYQSLTLPTFIFAIAILFIASFLTIGFKVFAAASINPATILKDE